MPADHNFEQGIQALLDGLPLALEDPVSQPAEPLRVMDAISRANRVAIFGKDIPLDRPMSSTWGHLEVRGEIGRGASGTVYRAWDARLAREVALKLLAPDADQGDALEEGRLLARLNHPHIVRVFGAHSHDGIAGIWMELLEGETLDDIQGRDGVFSAEETLLIGLDLARALSAVHSAGLLHRDVKTRNVLRERGGRIVLMDLSAGRAADREGGDETGTPMYMAPEVLAGGSATVQSDIYSLGVLLYRLLTRAFPVQAGDFNSLRAAHAGGDRKPLRARRQDVSADLAVAIERGCHPDPESRYASAAEFEAALAGALQHILLDRSHVAPRMARAWLRWRRATVGSGAAIALVFMVAWTAWNTTQGRSGRRALGLVVPPHSPLYLTSNGGIAIVRGRTFTLVPYNPATALPIAVSTDLGIQTMPGMPPWTAGGGFRLDGTPVVAPSVFHEGPCCFSDGTTDGEFNYAARADSTLLEPIGSRRLAPAALYRFGRDWSNPQLYFPLVSDGVYPGVAYSAQSGSFWLTRRGSGEASIEEWSRTGRQLSTPVRLSGAVLAGIAVDPEDGSLWTVRWASSGTRLENFDTSGRHLASLEVGQGLLNLGVGGAEFAWNSQR